MQKLAIIDRLKAFAILSIVIYHYLQPIKDPTWFSQAINFGGTGVHLFVLLSGFGLYLSHSKRPLPYLTFIKKRLTKVYIPYIIVVLFTAIISIFTPLYEYSTYALLGHVFLFKMFDESIIFSYGYHLWFISMIIQFYIVFHPLAWLKNKLGSNPFLLATIILSACWWVYVWYIEKTQLRTFNSAFPQFLWEFGLGMILAERMKSGKLQTPQWANPGAYFSLGVFAAIPYALLAIKGGSVGQIFNDWFALTAYGFIALAIVSFPIAPLQKALNFIGSISYSVYLWHFLIWLVIRQYSGIQSVPLQGIVALLLAISLSFAYQQVIGKLMLRLLPK